MIQSSYLLILVIQLIYSNESQGAVYLMESQVVLSNSRGRKYTSVSVRVQIHPWNITQLQEVCWH